MMEFDIWTFYLIAAAVVVGNIVSAFGVYFLYQCFKAIRERGTDDGLPWYVYASVVVPAVFALIALLSLKP